LAVRKRAIAAMSFAGAAAGGVALGWLAERRAVGSHPLSADHEWRELRRPVPGRPCSVEGFDGTALHAEVTGPEGAPTLVLAHGYGMAVEGWHYQRRDLSDEFRVVAYDQRGHGRSEEAVGGDYSVTALGRDLAAVLDALVPAPSRAVVVGHSMGGMALLAFADSFPELVERRLAGVVLVNTTGGDVIAGGAVSTGVAALSAIENQIWTRAFRLLGRGTRVADRAYRASTDLSWLITRAIGLSPTASPAHVAFVEQLMLNCPNSVKAALGPTLTSLNLRHAARLISVPSLVLVGQEDRLTPPSSARKLVAELPDARLIEIAGVGHNAPIEAYETVNAHLRLFARRAFAHPV